MANLIFKRGLQSALPTTAQDGVFYLTTDTNRLYVGQSNSTAPVLLNQTVQIVPAVSYLPGKENNLNGIATKNDFYYCTAENILAIYTGTEWKQVNPDTDTNDTIKVTQATVATPEVKDNKISQKVTLGQQKVNKNGVNVGNLDTSVNFTIQLTKADLEEILPPPAVGLGVTSGTNKATIKTAGTGSDASKTAIIAGGTNVTVSSSGSTITVSAKDDDTTYTIGASTKNNKATLSLTDSDGVADDVTFAAGKDLTVSAASDVITYAHKTITTTDDDLTNTEVSLNHGGTFDVITAVEADNGHITKYTTKKMKLPEVGANTSIREITGIATTNAEADWKNTIVETDGTTHTVDFSVDAAALREGLEELISEGLAAANTALTYKGTVSTYAGLSTKTNVEIGDVWMLSAADGSYKVGDLFIATVKENGSHTGGVINSGDVAWTYVPSGDELNTDTLFYGDVTVTAGTAAEGGKVTYDLKASANADGVTPSMPSGHETLQISGGKDILISGSGTSATVNHRTYNAVTPSNSAESSKTSFTAVTGVTLTNGHVTGINTKTFTPTDTTYTLDGENDKIELKTGDGVAVSTINVAGDTWITADVTNDKLSISHAAPKTTGATTKSVTNNALTAGGSLNILTGVTYDEKGHVSNVATGSVTLPVDNNTTYDMYLGSSSTSASAVTSATANPYLILKDKDGLKDSVQIAGDSGSLSVKSSANGNGLNISLEWGTF